MDATFLDTGVWYAAADSGDQYHARAETVLRDKSSLLVTNWPVVWEAITLVARRLGGAKAAQFGREAIAEKWAKILDLSSTDHVVALDLLDRYRHLRLSAAGVTSCALVRRLDISRDATFDEDFRIVLPERTILGLT